MGEQQRCQVCTRSTPPCPRRSQAEFGNDGEERSNAAADLPKRALELPDGAPHQPESCVVAQISHNSASKPPILCDI